MKDGDSRKYSFFLELKRCRPNKKNRSSKMCCLNLPLLLQQAGEPAALFSGEADNEKFSFIEERE